MRRSSLLLIALFAAAPACNRSARRPATTPAKPTTPAPQAAETPPPAPAPVTVSPDGVQRVVDGARVLENIPSRPPQLSERLRSYLEARRADVVGWDASGNGLYIRTRFAN